MRRPPTPKTSSSGTGRGAAVALALGLMLGCDGCNEPEPEPEPEVVTSASPWAEQPSHPIERPPTAIAQVTRVTATREGAATDFPLTRGSRLGDAAVVHTGDVEVALNLEQGGRIEIEPQTLGRVATEAPGQMILGTGSMRGVLAPVGGSPRPPLRIGTPHGSVEIGGSGELWVSVLPSGSTWVSALSGRGVVWNGEGEPVALQAGQSIVIGAPQPVPGPRTLVEARAAATTLIEQASPTPNEDALGLAMAALEAALSAVEAERARGAALADQQREAVRSKSGQAATIQRTIIEHSRDLGQVLRQLLVRYERARATALAAGSDPDPSSAIRPRVRAALGL